MVASDSNQNSIKSYRRLRQSTTIDRRTVTRPTGDYSMLTKKNEVVIKRVSKSQQTQDMVKATNQTEQKETEMKDETVAVKRPTAQEIKNDAIEKALAKAAKQESYKVKKTHVHFGFKRVLLALACSAVAVFAIVYFVNLNAPNISLRVTAMQTGIEASYPAYVPRDFNLSDITSENGKITLNFKNASSGDAFSLIEEKSSWDSNALLNNYVRSEFGENYIAIREQGLTIYIREGSAAAWVNGGIVYKLKTLSGTLTKKQIKSIAVSL